MSSGLEVVRWTSGRIRIGPWHGDERIAYVSPVGDGRELQPSDIESTLRRLADAGYQEAITAAIGPGEARSFLEVGFEVHERLHLLARDLHRLPDAPPADLRRARRKDVARVLQIDGAAFDEFWRLDEAGLEEALSATPSSRFRVATRPGRGPIVGYAVCGRAGRRGFVQRLAVDPAEEGHGLGRALLLDGLQWLKRRGVERVVVNTQVTNERALALYERLGFRRQPGGLAVLEKRL
jgi:ribosomal protein S18 acetylase RimI-like enzyme